MTTICPCEYVVIARNDHPDIGRTLDLKTFMSLGHIALIGELRNHATVDRDIITRGGNRRIVYLVNKVWSMPAMVADTDLVAVVPRRFAERMAPIFGLTLHEPPMPIAEQHFHMIWHENNNDDPGHKWLRETLMRQLRQDGPAAMSSGR